MQIEKHQEGPVFRTSRLVEMSAAAAGSRANSISQPVDLLLLSPMISAYSAALSVTVSLLASGEFRQHELICQQHAGLAPGPWQARLPGQEEMKFDSSFC